jgi:thymidylate kinase
MAINRPLLLRYRPDCVVFLDIDPQLGYERSFDPLGDKHEKNPLPFFYRLQE